MSRTDPAYFRTSEILKKMEKGLLTVEFTAKYLARFLKSGTLSRQDFLEFTQVDEIRTRYKTIEGEVGKI
ncbi:MAG TPA: hypothetical protein PKH10_08450 [bacterium]|nr:hypothetical protein [bacterium]